MSAQPEIDFEKMDGLVAGIVQDARTGEVLMLGFLNPDESFCRVFCRTRKKPVGFCAGGLLDS